MGPDPEGVHVSLKAGGLCIAPVPNREDWALYEALGGDGESWSFRILCVFILTSPLPRIRAPSFCSQASGPWSLDRSSCCVGSAATFGA